jgi:hypothetical protein
VAGARRCRQPTSSFAIGNSFVLTVPDELLSFLLVSNGKLEGKKKLKGDFKKYYLK